MMNIKFCSLAAATSLALISTSASAHTIEQNTVNLPAVAGNGGTHTINVSCGAGYVASGGGFSTDEASADHWPFVVSKSYPSGRRTWTIELVNKSAVVTHSKPGYVVTAYTACVHDHHNN